MKWLHFDANCFTILLVSNLETCGNMTVKLIWFVFKIEDFFSPTAQQGITRLVTMIKKEYRRKGLNHWTYCIAG